jgi:hypothetical protein
MAEACRRVDVDLSVVRVCSGMKGRGQKATEEQKRQLVSALSVLEAHGGVPNPVQVRG